MPAQLAWQVNAAQLGKLAIHKSDQGDSCKIEPFWPQTHQRVTAVSQNALDRRCDDPGRDRRDAMMSNRWCRCGTDKQGRFHHVQPIGRAVELKSPPAERVFDSF
jgi:hypothetical protein